MEQDWSRTGKRISACKLGTRLREVAPSELKYPVYNTTLSLITKQQYTFEPSLYYYDSIGFRVLNLKYGNFDFTKMKAIFSMKTLDLHLNSIL